VKGTMFGMARGAARRGTRVYPDQGPYPPDPQPIPTPREPPAGNTVRLHVAVPAGVF